MHTRKLNDKQLNAIHLLVSGLTDTEVAEQIGVSRQTVNQWKNQDDDFIYELNKQRSEIWNQFGDHYRSLIPKAIKVLEEGLDSEDPKMRLEVARLILGKFKLEPKPVHEILEENSSARTNKQFAYISRY